MLITLLFVLVVKLNNSLLDLLVSNLSRLDESEDTDSQGVFHILGVFENLLSFMPPLADQIVEGTALLQWLLQRIKKKEYDSNKQYASEIMAILLQDSRANVLKLGQLDGMDVMLQVLSVSFNFRAFKEATLRLRLRPVLNEKNSNTSR